jgi:hypothetical protein
MPERLTPEEPGVIPLAGWSGTTSKNRIMMEV